MHRLCSRCEIDDVFKRNMEKIFNCRLLSRKFDTKRIIERLIKAPGLIDSVYLRIYGIYGVFGEEIDDSTCCHSEILSFIDSGHFGYLGVCLARGAGLVSRR